MFYTVDIQMTEPATPSTPPRREYKRERKQTAQILPPGITHNMMKKYVVYYREMTYLKDGKQQPREYFKVEAHPKLNKPWNSSKSVKISLIEKLNDANQVVDDLDAATATATATMAAAADISTITDRWAKRLPKYATLRIVRDTPTATILSANYDRKDNLNGFRWTGSHTFSLPIEDNAEAVDAVDAVIGLEIQILREKLREKYGLDLWGV
jgi:hypothetical protein